MNNSAERRKMAENRRASFDYFKEKEFEVGLILTGSEVKSLRQGGTNIAESYICVEGGELWLVNAYIAPSASAKTFGHEPRRRRKLLAGKREIAGMARAQDRDGMTLIPVELYANEKGMMKLSMWTAKGKKKADKRETSAKRDWGRAKQRILKETNR